MKTNHLDQISANIVALFEPLPFEVADGKALPRFSLIRRKGKGSVGIDSRKAVAITARIIELCIPPDGEVNGKLEMLVSWDPFTPEEIHQKLKKQFGKNHPLKGLLDGGHLDRLKEILAEPGLDFMPVGSEIVKILNKFIKPHEGIRKENDNEWNAIRIAIRSACKRLNEHFSPVRDWVPIRGMEAERKAKRKREEESLKENQE